MARTHKVAKGENLNGIAKMEKVSVETLRNLNDIKDVNKIQVGQKLYLCPDDVLGLQVLFLDIDRNPINGQQYLLSFNSKDIRGITGENGLAKKITTAHMGDRVEIVIERLDLTKKLVGTIESGPRAKLVTIVTNRYRVDAKAELDPLAKRGASLPQAVPIPIFDPEKKRPATTEKKTLGPQTEKDSTADGRPLAKVTGDVPDLDLIFDDYIACQISDDDILEAANKLRCRPGLIFAIAKQESSTSSFFKIGTRNVPKILFERHWFRTFTRPSNNAHSPYESIYPDICGPAYHRTIKNRSGELIDRNTGHVAEPDDIYGAGGVFQYKRMLKAYQLDPDAALEACSWGKFQIMGFNFTEAGFSSVGDFVRAMSRNDAEHMKAFLKFAAGNRTLLSGLRELNFEKIAAGHNGSGWRNLNPEYADNLRRYYEEYNSAHHD